MKKFFIIIIILKSSIIYSQTLNDRIVTITGDTIYGRVTLINNTNVFYDVKVKKHLEHFCLSLSVTKNIIIDKDNNPQVLLAGKSDSIISKSKNILSNGKVLFAENTKFNNWQDEPRGVTFYVGEKVALRCYDHDTITVRGIIESICDSSILISTNRANNPGHYKRIKNGGVMEISDSSGIKNAKRIKIKDIKEINQYKSGTVLIVGLSAFTALVGTVVVIGATFEPQYDEYGDLMYDPTYLQFGMIIAAFYDLITVIPTGIVLASTKHCRMNKHWKLKVTNNTNTDKLKLKQLH